MTDAAPDEAPLFRPLPDGGPGPAGASTGALPGLDRVEELLVKGHRCYRDVDEGTVADYIPALAGPRRSWFGACVATTTGRLVEVGDTRQPFSIQTPRHLPVRPGRPGDRCPDVIPAIAARS